MINKTSQKIMNTSNFFDRLEDKSKAKEAKKMVNLMVSDIQTDQETGNKLFEPQIKITPATSARKAKDVSTNLFYESKRRQLVTQAKQETLLKQQSEAQLFKSNVKSVHMVKDSMHSRLEDIFRMLDSD